MARALGAYLGLAVGDALGATVEFMTPREIKAQYKLHREIRGGGWLNLKCGHVTDDTTMSLALGRAILATGTIEASAIGAAFDAWMRSKPVDIGSTVRRGILNFRNNAATSVAHSEHDAGNGACMRVLPVALATLGQSDAQIAAAVMTQSHLTHNNPLSDAGTLCVVQMVQQALQGSGRVELLFGPVRSLIERHPEFAFRNRRCDNPTGYIVDTLRAVFQSFFDTDSFEDCLIDVVNRGGDADTTGAIAGMIAGACYGLEAIPARWLKSLERETAAQCRHQAAALLALSRPTS